MRLPRVEGASVGAIYRHVERSRDISPWNARHERDVSTSLDMTVGVLLIRRHQLASISASTIRSAMSIAPFNPAAT